MTHTVGRRRQNRPTNSTGVEIMTVVQTLRQFVRDEEGVTAIEYGLIASLVAVALIVGATLLGTKLNDMFTFIAGKMKTS
jgi:pilus assembly protein Flp/PilA